MPFAINDPKHLARYCPLHIGIMPLQDTLFLLIVGEYGTQNGEAFLNWLIHGNGFYVRRLMTEDALKHAKAMLVGLEHLNYSNADCDWRNWLTTFCMEQVPARVWWSYQQTIATLVDEM